jgi:hypothetical protein
MRRLFTVLLAAFFACFSPHHASAQSALKELEQKIRQQLGAAEATPAPADPRASTPVAAPPAGIATKPEKPGYLGLVADDPQQHGQGVRILEVTPGGPADRAGLRANDLIVGLGGVKIRELSEMAAVVEHVPPDGVLEFQVIRDNQPLTRKVTFGRKPPQPGKEPTVRQPVPVVPQSVESRMGMLERRIEDLEQRVILLEQALRKARGDQ